MPGLVFSSKPPEVTRFLDELSNVLIEESDRGAVLVGTSYVDETLRTFFETMIPASCSRKKSKALLDYPGTLSSLSAKIEVAYVTRLIDADIYKSLHALRRIRNEVAHAPASFSLSEHKDKIRQIYDLSKGMPEYINLLATRVLESHIIDITMERPEGPRFESYQEAFDYVNASPNLKTSLLERLPKIEFVMGIAMLTAFLIGYRNHAKSLLGENSTLAALDLPEGAS